MRLCGRVGCGLFELNVFENYPSAPTIKLLPASIGLCKVIVANYWLPDSRFCTFSPITDCYVLVICTVKWMLINNVLLISSLALADDASRPGVDLWLSWLWLSWSLWTLSQGNGYHRSCLPDIWLMASLSSSLAQACYEQDALIEEGEWALRRLVFLLKSISWS